MINDVEVRAAGQKGLGVFARRPFSEGEFIFRRRNGRVVNEAGIPTLSLEDQMHLTELGFNRFAVVRPPGAYLNHSCDPNAMRSGVKVFAWRAIRTGEEIVIDYRLNAFDGSSWPCTCGSANCTGRVVGSFSRWLRNGNGRICPTHHRSSVASTTRGDLLLAASRSSRCGANHQSSRSAG